jgi:hypothetical protein
VPRYSNRDDQAGRAPNAVVRLLVHVLCPGNSGDHAAGEIAGAVPELGQLIRRLAAAAGRERGEFDVLLDLRHRRYRCG